MEEEGEAGICLMKPVLLGQKMEGHAGAVAEKVHMCT